MTTDAVAPLVFKGQLCLSTDDITYTDVSDELTKAQLHFTKDAVAVPATAGQPKTTRGGGSDCSLELGFLSTDGTGGTLWPMLYAAAATVTGVLYFHLLMRDGGESATNPQWNGSVVVTGAALGADAEALSADSQTFPCTDLPTLNEA